MNFSKIFGWYFIEKLLAIGFSLVVTAMVAKNLGAELFGRYSYYQSLCLVLSFLFNLGLDGIAARELIRNKDKSEYILYTLLLLRLMGFLVFILAVFLFLKSSDSQYDALLVAVIVFHFFKIFQSLRVYLEVAYEVKSIAIASVLAKTFSILMAYVFLLENGAVFWLASIDSLIFGVGVFILILRRVHNFKIGIGDFVLFSKEMLIEALPVVISLVLSGLFMQTDLMIIKMYHGDSVAGIYSAAMALVLPAAFLPAIIISIFGPGMVKLYGLPDKNSYNEYCSGLSQLLFAAGLLLFLGIFILAPLVVKVMYGDGYKESVDILRTLAIIPMFSFPAFLYSRMLVIERKLEIELVKSAISAFFSVLLNLLFVPKYGVYAAAICSVLAYMLADLIVYRLFLKTRNVFIVAIRSVMFLNIKAVKCVLSVEAK